MDNSGPAFPTAPNVLPGMSLRDYFAASCIQGMIAAATSWRSSTPEQWAEIAYQISDALIAEREKPITTPQPI